MTIMPTTAISIIRVVCLWLVFTALPASGADQGASHGADALNQHLLSGIHACFSGDYDRAWDIFTQVREIDADHPSREYYQAIVLFWKNNIDHNNPRYDAQIRKLLRSSLTKSEKLLKKDDNNIEALHYAGLAYTYLGRMDAHRKAFYEGGRKGETGRKYLEKAVVLCGQMPEKRHALQSKSTCSMCEDIYFPLGAYTYFAGKLPKFLRYVNFLWFIPKGSGEEGLELLARAEKNACLHQLGTQSLLANIYAIFETHRLHDAFALSTELVRQFPDNPYLDLEHAGILIKTRQYSAAYDHAQAILEKVTSKTRNYDPVTELGALLFMVESDFRRQHIRQAEERLGQIKNNPAYQNNTLFARIVLLQGQLADLRNNRQQAQASYRKVISLQDHLCDRETRKKAEKYLDEPFTLIAG